MTRRKVINNLLSSATVTVVSAVAVIVIQVLVSRTYGSTVFGVYTLVLAIGRIMLAASDLGVSTFVYREVARFPERTCEWVDTGMFVRVRSAAACIVLSMAVFWFLGPHGQMSAALMLFLDLIFGDLAVFFSYVFVARRDTHLQALVSVPTMILRTSLCALVITLDCDLWILASALVGCHAMQLVWGLVISRRRGWASVPRPVHVRRLLVAAWPIGVSNTVGALYFKLDSLLLAAILSPQHVGLYNAAYLLATGTTLASVVIRSVAFPELSSAFRSPAFRRIARRFAMAVAATSVFAVLVIWLLGPWVIDQFFGPEFAASKDLVPVFAIASAAVFANEAAQATLLATHQQTLDLRCGVFALSLNVILNLLLIPRIGIAGAAWATLATEATGAVTRLWFGRIVIREASRSIVSPGP